MTTFLAIAFGLAWLCQVPVYAGGLEGPAALALLALGGIAPSVAALVATRGAVWRATWRGRRPAWALVLGLAGPSALVALAGLIGGELALGAPLLGAVLLPPIGEELGWRGYLQPRLRARLDAATASLVCGLVWAVWHLPTAIGHWHTFPAFVASVTAGGLIMGWLWERTRGSILAAVALHAGMNLGLLTAPRWATTVVWTACGLAALAALVRISAPAPQTPSS